MGDLDHVSFGGETVDRRTRAMLREAQRISNERDPSIGKFQLSQGSFSHSVGASAGTHDGPGAFDLSVRTYTEHQKQVIALSLRKVGFASWRRFPSQGNWPEHIHGIAIGTKGLPPVARSQIQSYLNGRDGLRGSHRDTQPRPDQILTWEQYEAAHPGLGDGGAPTAAHGTAEATDPVAGVTTDPYDIDAGQGVSGDSARDSDGDGLTDEFEKLARTDPLNADTNGDGVPDGSQLLTSQGRFGTGVVLDSDHDGVADWLESAAQHSQLAQASALATGNPAPGALSPGGGIGTGSAVGGGIGTGSAVGAGIGTGSAVGAGIATPTHTALPPGATGIEDGSGGELLGN
jgi:hypothetical protein